VPIDDREAGLDRLLELLQVVGHELEEAARSVDLTVPQALLVRMLDQPMRMGDLANLRVCDPSSLTTMALRLEHAGLIVRRPDPNDRRARIVSLTAEGEDVHRRFVARLLREASSPTGSAGNPNELDAIGSAIPVLSASRMASGSPRVGAGRPGSGSWPGLGR
jgi:DNA-binding MarR family transcriptional regulator